MAWPSVYDLDSSSFDNGASRKPSKPTIILVHDAFHTNAHFTRLLRELQEANYKVLTPQLPSSSSTYQADIFEADVQTIHDYAKSEVDGSRNVVLVLHGYSGMPGSVAAERLNRYALSRPRTGFVAKIVFLAAIIANEGECFCDVAKPNWLTHEVTSTDMYSLVFAPTDSSQNGLLGVRKPDEVFYQDCSSENARTAVAMLRPQIADSFRTRVSSPGWSQVPCIYIICELDNAIHPNWQRACFSKLQSSNPRTAAVVLQAGHSPHISKVKEMATLVVRSLNGS